MGRMKGAPQKKYAKQFESVKSNKLRHFAKSGAKGCVPMARPGKGQPKVPVV